MTDNRSGRQILIHGLAMVLAGLLWGFVVSNTPFPRWHTRAYIQFTSNGLLFAVLALLLLTLPNRIGAGGPRVMLLAAWLTWGMLFSEAANASWGTNQILPIAASQAGAHGREQAWQETIVKLAHIAAGIALVVAWTLLVIGFIRQPVEVGGGQVARAIAAPTSCDAADSPSRARRECDPLHVVRRTSRFASRDAGRGRLGGPVGDEASQPRPIKSCRPACSSACAPRNNSPA